MKIKAMVRLKIKWTTFFLLLVTTIICAIIVYTVTRSHDFECRARVQNQQLDNTCKKISAFDMYLSLYSRRQGYILLSGSYSCTGAPPQSLTEIVNFSYHKEGNYYSIRLGRRNPQLTKLMELLKPDDIKIKITQIDRLDYILSTPIQTLMICTREK